MSERRTFQLSKKQTDLLRRIAAEDVTWRWAAGYRASYRLWSSEHEYTLITQQVKRLISLRLAESFAGMVFGRGGVRLTNEGRRHLALVEAPRRHASET